MIQLTDADAFSHWESIAVGWKLNDDGKAMISEYVFKFGIFEVLSAMDVAEKYLDYQSSDCVTSESFNNALDKVGGIAYNRRYRWQQG